jgi:hypothetical protein
MCECSSTPLPGAVLPPHCGHAATLRKTRLKDAGTMALAGTNGHWRGENRRGCIFLPTPPENGLYPPSMTSFRSVFHNELIRVDEII